MVCCIVVDVLPQLVDYLSTWPYSILAFSSCVPYNFLLRSLLGMCCFVAAKIRCFVSPFGPRGRHSWQCQRKSTQPAGQMANVYWAPTCCLQYFLSDEPSPGDTCESFSICWKGQDTRAHLGRSLGGDARRMVRTTLSQEDCAWYSGP